ncbi:hypothetical protein GCM10027294_25770 [Marinactinospora endophytica]
MSPASGSSAPQVHPALPARKESKDPQALRVSPAPRDLPARPAPRDPQGRPALQAPQGLPQRPLHDPREDRMVDIISRSQWGARAPRSRQTVSWSARTEFVVHYSAGPPSQTPRQIQAFHMDSNGWSDVGYNFLVDTDGKVYEGRGWLVVGAHAAPRNTQGIGVCFIGGNGDATPAARNAIRALYDEANRKAGRTLAIRGHRDINSTSCPGDELYAWVRDGMPVDHLDMTGADMVGLKEGDKGERVKLLQELLRAGGHDLGPAGIDGHYGPATSKAVLAARRAEGSKQHFGDEITGAAAKQILSQFIKAHL